MEYWVIIKAKLGEDQAQELYKKLRYNKVNMFVENQVHIYGNADENVIKEILFTCGKLGADIQLNIK